MDLSRRPREPPRAGVRRERQMGDTVELPPSAKRHVPGARAKPALLHRRKRAAGREQPRLAECRAARQYPYAEGRGLGAAWHDTRRLPARPVHNAARHRRRQPRQHLYWRIVRKLLAALLERSGAGTAPRHPPPAQDHRVAAKSSHRRLTKPHLPASVEHIQRFGRPHMAVRPEGAKHLWRRIPPG
jgi:hypothetical protein